MKLILGLMFAGAAFAQTEKVEFEVASIKLAAPDARGMFISPGPGGGIKVTNMTLKEMIVLAWRVQPYQVSGGPAWIDKLHFDIVAKPEARPKQAEMLEMLRALLKERFQLEVRPETKELPIYAMVLARKDGKLGPQLTEMKEGGCVKYDAEHRPPQPEPGKPPTPGCGGMMMGMNVLRASGAPVSQMMIPIGRMLGRTVIDKTGLTAKYDITMNWTPDETQFGLLPPGVERPTFPEGGPTIFTALQEQLGLKLESQKGPVEILTVERAEKPAEN